MKATATAASSGGAASSAEQDPFSQRTTPGPSQSRLAWPNSSPKERPAAPTLHAAAAIQLFEAAILLLDHLGRSEGVTCRNQGNSAASCEECFLLCVHSLVQADLIGQWPLDVV